MKRIKMMMLALCMIFTNLTISHILKIEATTKQTTYDGSNIDYNNYNVYNRTRTSFLAIDNDKMVRIQQLSDKKLLIENYDLNYQFIDSKLIESEADYFGGAYVAHDANYLVWGNINPDEDDTKQVFRISKYDKDWNYITSCGLNGANTTIPFDAGTCDMTMNGKYLIIHTSHEMYKISNVNHQANVTIMVDTDNMEISYSLTAVSSITSGYVTHSFNQVVEMDGNDVIMVDHGDAHPRSMVLIKSKDNDGTSFNNITHKSLFAFAGESGNNYTGASLGGLAISSSNYLVVGNSIVQDENYETNETRNIFITSCDKQLGNTTTSWLTNYVEGEESAKTPYISKINDNQFVVMWSRKDDVYYCVVDGNGEKQSDIVWMDDANLSDCEPVVKDNKIIWYTWNNENINFYEIDMNNLVHPQVISFKNGNRSEKGFCGDGVHEKAIYCEQINPTCIDDGIKSHYECSRCAQILKSANELETIDDTTFIIPALDHDFSDIIINEDNSFNANCTRCNETRSGYCPNSFTLLFNNSEDNGYYYPVPNNIQHIGDPLNILISRLSPKAADASLKFEISNPNIARVEYDGKYYAINFCQAGRVKIKISSMYNSSIYSTFTFDVDCPSDGHVSMWVEQSEPTCLKEGASAHYECENCHRYLLEDGRVMDNYESLIIPKLAHDLVKHERVDATCSCNGIDEYYSCNKCNSIILKDKVTIAASMDEVVIPSLPHTYKFSRYSNGKYYQKCINCHEEVECEAIFKDVNPKAWYVQSVYDAYAKGLMVGINDENTLFSPNDNISRGMVATVLYRMAKAPKVTFSAKFPDVKNGLWYSNAIIWANQIGVVKGYNNGKFGPDDNITRQDLAIMLRNYAMKVGKLKASEKADLSKFKDVKAISPYALPSLEWAVANKLISGKENGTKVAPIDNATRAECAKMFNILSNICSNKAN